MTRDLLDIRDATANTMVIASPPAPAGAEPLAINGIVCLAGCDHGVGSVVYRETPKPSLASISAPVLTKVAIQPDTAPALASMQPLTCIAGCYEPPARRTVDSLKTQYVKATPQPSAQRKPRALVDQAPVAVPADPVPVVTADKPVKLRTAYATSEPTSRVKRWSQRSQRVAKPHAKATRKVAGPQYGKVVVVPTSMKPAAPAVDATPSPAAPAPAEAPPVSTYSPTPRKSEKRTQKVQPVANVSTDWFNKLKQDSANKAPSQ